MLTYADARMPTHQAAKTEAAFLVQLKRAHNERDAAQTERDAALLERTAARLDADEQAAAAEAAGADIVLLA